MRAFKSSILLLLSNGFVWLLFLKFQNTSENFRFNFRELSHKEKFLLNYSVTVLCK